MGHGAQELTKKASAADASGRIHGRKCDVASVEEVLAAFQWVRETFGRLDVLVNNAGILKATFVLGHFSFNCFLFRMLNFTYD